MALMLQLIFTLFTLSSNTECSDVFVSVGDSVQLHTQEPVPEFRTLFWRFNKNENVLEYLKKYKDITPSPRLKDRWEFNNETYSLTLKNLQKTDSGLYEAIAAGDKGSVVAVYTLSVLDPVEAPVLSAFPKESSSDLCNITVSCRSDDLSINFMCYNKTCQEKTEAQSGNTVLSVFINERSIICNHSNQVSWKNAVLEMRRFCGEKDSVSSSAGVSVCLLKIVLFSTALILMVSAVITVHIRGRLRKSS
ncbi:CD48 antigen-like [Hoplias malabaricus]|uniref:CD48 antigen-like n=1 Tax=Hoplias malabaricus TaxID=27720 RepID=UPI003461CCBC